MHTPVGNSFGIRSRKLKRLGFSSYTEYLKSDLWKNIKSEILNTQKTCKNCGAESNLNVHHVSYTYMSTPTYKQGRAKSLIVLCQNCHNYVHEIAKNYNLGLTKATQRLLKGTSF